MTVKRPNASIISTKTVAISKHNSKCDRTVFHAYSLRIDRLKTGKHSLRQLRLLNKYKKMAHGADSVKCSRLVRKKLEVTMTMMEVNFKHIETRLVLKLQPIGNLIFSANQSKTLIASTPMMLLK